MIPVPESVTYYWAEPTNQAAVNLLVDRTEIPPDLELEEVEQFEVASLAAQRVRLDFWRLLRQLWSATWGEAVRTALPEARLLNFEAHRDFQTDAITPSIEEAWAERATFGLFEVSGQGKLVTRLMFADKRCRELVLSFYFINTDGEWTISDALELGPDWSNDEGWRSTRLTVDRGANHGGFDLDDAAQATRNATGLLSDAIR